MRQFLDQPFEDKTGTTDAIKPGTTLLPHVAC